MSILLKKYAIRYQYLISIGTIVVVTTICFALRSYVDYKSIAFILLLFVSLLAMMFDIRPVLLATVLSAGIWNFFFIPPIFTFHIASANDNLLFLSYFFLALVHSALTYKIRAAEKEAQGRKEKEKTIQLYNTLLNSLSHELKTPIAAIIGSADTFIEQMDKLSIENRVALLETIQLAGAKLNEQVENLLSVSRLESGSLQPKADWCDIAELLYSCKQYHPHNDRINIETAENLPLIFIDHGLLKQVIDNLLRNALQYSEPDSAVSVKARMEVEQLMISVYDHGKGIKKEDIHRVFDKFYRVEGSLPGGTGLGLSIVKGFTDALGGTIEITPNTPKGSIFTLSLQPQTSYIRNLKQDE